MGRLFPSNGNRSVFGRIAKNFSIGSAGAATSIGIALGQTALLTKVLPIEDYGRVLIVTNLFVFVLLFADVRVHDVLYRFYPLFRNGQRDDALAALLLMSLGICLAAGISVATAVSLLAPWIANAFYSDPGLAGPMRTYAAAAVFSSLQGFSTPILRLHDRFSAIVVAQVAGALVTVFLLAIYLLGLRGSDLRVIVGILATGMVVRTLFPFIGAVRLVSALRIISPRNVATFWHGLAGNRRRIGSTLFHTNLAGYLKLGSEPAGVFLLGVLSSPSQVALFGIAQQLTRPLRLLQTNVQNAITPEVADLWAQRRIEQLRELVYRMEFLLLAAAGALMLVALAIARPVILMVTTTEYLNAIPIFYVLTASVFVSVAGLLFYPLAVCMDQMKRRNWIVSLRLLYLAGGAFVGLNAMVLGTVQLVGTLSTRLLFDLPLFRRLRTLASPVEPASNIASARATHGS